MSTPAITESKFALLSRSIRGLLMSALSAFFLYLDLPIDDPQLAQIADVILLLIAAWGVKLGYIGRRDAKGSIHILPLVDIVPPKP